MRNSNADSIMSKYTDAKLKTKKHASGEMPLMAAYEQRYKGGMSRTVTEPKKQETLSEKISSRDIPEQRAPEPVRVPVEIGGTRYLLGTSDDMSESRIRSVASCANRILTDVMENNTGLTNSKTAILALIDCCDMLLSAKEERDSLKLELLYLEQRERAAQKENPIEPTPMEKLADEASKGKK